MYHKVARSPETMWWVSAAAFHRQMCELRTREVVSLDAYDPANPRHAVITFDGVYENVYQFAFPILRAFGYPFELFVISDVVGQGNEFDEAEPACRFASAAQLAEMARAGGRLQFHTRSHRRLDGAADGGLSATELAAELTVPAELRALDPEGFGFFAYPHGDFSQRVLEQVRQRYLGAVTCVQGDATDRHRLNRETVLESTRLASRTIGVLVASYNYGDFLGEAVESVLRQTLKPDRILIVDDASSDCTLEVGRAYAELHPQRVEFERNPENLGIVANFNRGVERLGTDYVCILGADNRMPSHYLAACAEVLDRDPRCAIAYTDLALFGARAGQVYANFFEAWRAGTTADVYWNIEFPALDGEAAIAQIGRRNFIHGSSMYRREAFDAIGGYRAAVEHPEDHDLFARMLAAGHRCGKARTFLEYRHHSPDQANARAQLQQRLALGERVAQRQRARIAELEAALAERSLLGMARRDASTLVRSLRSAGIRTTAARIRHRIRQTRG